MRTNIDIDDKLMKQAMKASSLESRTKKAVVEEALALLVKMRNRAEGLRRLQGRVQFADGYDYKAMRRDDCMEGASAPDNMKRLPGPPAPRRKKAA